MIKQYFSIAKSIFKKSKTVSHLPPHIQMDVTTYCNLNCQMCYRTRIMKNDEVNIHMSFDNFKNMFDKIKPRSVNLAAYGEPFINPDIFRMIKYARQNNSQSIIATNYSLPGKSIATETVKSGLDILKISIDGATEETYKNVRNINLSRVKENIKQLQETKKNFGTTKPYIRIDFVILKTNYNEIPEMLKFAEQMNIDYVYFRICDPRGWTDKDKEKLLKGCLDGVSKKIDEAMALEKRARVRTNLDIIKRNFNIWKFIYENTVPPEDMLKERNVCLLPWLQLFVSIQGDTSYCCSIYPSRDANMGNIFKNDISEIWNGKNFQKTRELFLKKENYKIYEGCKYCIPMSFRNLFGISMMFPKYFRKLNI